MRFWVGLSSPSLAIRYLQHCREFAMDRLSISRSIALEHGGTLELDKESPHTCFRLKLPLSGMPKSNAQLKKR
jgi:hypothetical protein